MIDNTNTYHYLFFFFLLSFTLLFVTTGCSNKPVKVGESIPSQEIIKLSDVIAAPQDYNGKKIVMKGIISGQCPSLCEFFFQDGAHKATIFPQGFKFPKFETGKPVTIYAEVTSGTENIVFSALGVTVDGGK
jgi:hypothetical protein